jgi:hypothetical protein
MTADRYVRLGTDVPQIYQGSLTGLSRAIKDALNASARVEGTHVMEAVYGRERKTLMVFQGGVCVWDSTQEEEEA